jgi:hypothetical protein
VAPKRRDDSPSDVQGALDYLVKSGCLTRVTLADGTVIYTGVQAPN